MPQYGTVKRAKPRLRVLRGFDPNEPRTRTASYPVPSDVTIKSGQVIYVLWDSGAARYEWQLGCVAGAIPHIALQDSADEDVIEADSLVGLSCSGQFELATGYFKGADTYNVDVALTFDDVTGDVKATTVESGAAILGFVSRIRGAQDLGPGTTGSGAANTYSGVPGQDSSATDLDVIVFNTQYLPNSADAVV